MFWLHSIDSSNALANVQKRHAVHGGEELCCTTEFHASMSQNCGCAGVRDSRENIKHGQQHHSMTACSPVQKHPNEGLTMGSPAPETICCQKNIRTSCRTLDSCLQTHPGAGSSPLCPGQTAESSCFQLQRWEVSKGNTAHCLRFWPPPAVIADFNIGCKGPLSRTLLRTNCTPQHSFCDFQNGPDVSEYCRFNGQRGA